MDWKYRTPYCEETIDALSAIPAPNVRLTYAKGGQSLTWCPPVVRVEKSPWHEVFTVPLLSDELEAPHLAIVEVTFETDLAWYLNSRREFVDLSGEVTPPWPVGCLTVLKRGDLLLQVQFDPVPHFRLRRNPKSLTAILLVRDHSACGLRLWGENKLGGSPLHYSIRVEISRLAQLSDAVWKEPFPGAARSVICITDHPDWDSVPKASALCDLFADHGLRITKGVFPVADSGWDYGPGLDSPEYAAVIDRWHEAGHEIAYHGLGSGMHAPADADECLRRMDRLDPYTPRTWIDHSCGEHTFARAARLPGDIDLVAVLAAKGVRNFWSYADVWQNPASDLQVVKSRSAHSAFADFLRLAWRRGYVGPLQLAYLGTIPIKNLTGPSQYRDFLREPWSVSQWCRMRANYRLLRVLNRRPLCLYGLNGDFFSLDPDGTMIFDTLLLNHVALQLCPSNIERLVRDNGVLIAHTYLAAVHKKGGRNCFRVDRETQFLEGFRENIQHISALQKRGDLVTLPITDLREALLRHSQMRIVKTADGWEVRGDAVVSSRTPYRIGQGHLVRDSHGVFSAAIRGVVILANP